MLLLSHSILIYQKKLLAKLFDVLRLLARALNLIFSVYYLTGSTEYPHPSHWLLGLTLRRISPEDKVCFLHSFFFLPFFFGGAWSLTNILEIVRVVSAPSTSWSSRSSQALRCCWRGFEQTCGRSACGCEQLPLRYLRPVRVILRPPAPFLPSPSRLWSGGSSWTTQKTRL